MKVGRNAKAFVNEIRGRLAVRPRDMALALRPHANSRNRGSIIDRIVVPAYAKNSILKLKVINNGEIIDYKDFLIAMPDISSAVPLEGQVGDWPRSAMLDARYWYVPSLEKGQELHSPSFEVAGVGAPEIQLVSWLYSEPEHVRIDLELRIIAISKDEVAHEIEFIKGFGGDCV